MPAAPRQATRPSRSTARLAAVQALYQRDMSGTPADRLVDEFAAWRLNEPVDGERLAPPDAQFFAGLVAGAAARASEIDRLIEAHIAEGWALERIDRPLLAILRAAVFELIARPDISVGTVISEYLNVAHAFYERRDTGFVNGVLDAVAREVRAAA